MKRRFWFAPVLAILLAGTASSALAGKSPPLGASLDRLAAPAAVDTVPDPFVPHFRVQILPEHPTTATPVTLQLTGPSPYPLRCADVIDPIVNSQTYVSFTLWPSAAPCSSGTPWLADFGLGQFPAGTQSVIVEVYYHPAFSDSSGDTTRVRVVRNVEFYVAPDAIPPLGLPYVESVRIVPAGNRPFPIEPRICPGDSIGVLFSGHFPTDCFGLLRIEVLPTVQLGGVPPQPPLLRLVVDSTRCLPRLCTREPIAWNAAVIIPPLPNSGSYDLPVDMVLGSCLGPIELPPPSYFSIFRFAVSPCSTSVGSCVLGAFEHPNGYGGCDAHVSAGRADQLTFAVKPSVALSGLQGEFLFDQPGLRITRMVAVGPALGMHLTWTNTDHGARFVMFAASGAPIPDAPWQTDGLPIPVIAMEIVQPTTRRPAATTVMSYRALLGSDVYGQGVPQCRLGRPDDVARICREQDCDRNGDGLLDVRDLVLLVHCLTDSFRCDPTGADCNGDSLFNLDDVLCCARRLLGLQPCRECGPDSTPARHEPIELSLGGLVESQNQVVIPIRLTNAERFSAARLAIDYPADRYEVVGAGLRQADSGWLDLHEVRDGQVVIGLIRIGLMMIDLGNQKVELELTLRLKPGQTPGGSVVASESDFSGADGVRLIIEHGRTAIDLVGRATIDLSGARPNPFTNESRFSLTLDRAASVELAIYDVGGRLVSTIHRGILPAGTREFSWNGTNADGSRAATGVYFYRAAVAGTTASRKLVLVRGN
jgi:hypothetical protein